MTNQEEFNSIIEYTKGQLLGEMKDYGHNGLAIPHMSIRNLQTLIKYEEWYKSRGGQELREKFNDIANGRDNYTQEQRAGEHSGSKAYESDPKPDNY